MKLYINKDPAKGNDILEVLTYHDFITALDSGKPVNNCQYHYRGHTFIGRKVDNIFFFELYKNHDLSSRSSSLRSMDVLVFVPGCPDEVRTLPPECFYDSYVRIPHSPRIAEFEPIKMAVSRVLTCPAAKVINEKTKLRNELLRTYSDDELVVLRETLNRLQREEA